MRPRRDLVVQFWSGYLDGLTVEEAAAAVGVRGETGARWRRQAGGVPPPQLRLQLSGRFLSLSEREEIFAGVERGESIRHIARRLAREPSTVLRELRRNMRHQYRTRSRLRNGSGQKRKLPWDYRPSVAQRGADDRAARPKAARLAVELELRAEVQALLTRRMSPEQISFHLKHRFPHDARMQVSHETIYQSIYVQGRGALRRELAVCLRTGRALRHPHRKSNQRRGRIPGMVNISERPAEVEDRAIPGHWEGDLILGKYGRSAIGTLVERSTRFLVLLHLPSHTAESVEQAMVAATGRLPQMLWKSLTWDQGTEMTNHARITMATDLDIYFCDPASPWQRGSNENTNGLLRQYFPKGSDLSRHDADHLEFVSNEMNTRPRKTLGWATPAEALQALISASSHPGGVATTD